MMALSDRAARSKDRTVKVPNMQHRHFSFIADIIRQNDNPFDRAQAARAFADRLAETNPQFNRARFLAACEED